MERYWGYRIAFLLLFFGTLLQAQILPAVVDYDNYAVKKRYLDFRGLVSGTVDHVQLDTQVVTTQSFTVEFWVKMDDPSTPHNVNGQWCVNERGSGGGNTGLLWNYQCYWDKPLQRFIAGVRNNSNTASFISGEVSDSSLFNIQPNTWYHVANVCDASSITDTIIMATYINGVPGTIREWFEPVGRFISSSNVLRLGSAGFVAITSDVTSLKGSLDEVRIWDHARTPEQINRYKDKRLRCKETGLILYYSMNEGSGNTVGDCAGNNDGTRVNAPWVTN
jgi:hypothetical protein